MTRVYLGLGSNLGDSVQHLKAAITAIQALPHTQWRQLSSLYQSKPVGGPPHQPDFLNAVAMIDCELPALALLDALQTIEHAEGRVRIEHWGPRTLDLDILLYGDTCISHERLTVPHPHMTTRGFVLHPLYEIAPALILPNGQSLQDLVKLCPPEGLTRLSMTIEGI